MNESINLSSKTKLKTNAISTNCICCLKQKKSTKIFIGQAKGIHMYDSQTQAFEDIKVGENNNFGNVSCLTESDELIFFCYGMKIMATASNGKIIFESDTFLAVERIDSIHVMGYRVWLIAGSMINQFLIGGVQLSNKLSRITQSPLQKIEDVNAHMFDVKVNHSLLIKIDAEKPFLLLLMNNNQIFTFEKKEPSSIFSTESPPTYAYKYPNHEGNHNKILIGCMNGDILYLDVEKKKIKEIWKINESSKGRVNCIVEIKNGFLIFRDQYLEFWNKDRQLLGKQSITEKITSAIYLMQMETLLYGTSAGQVVQMYNYQKMIKQSKVKNQKDQRNALLKQISELNIMKQTILYKISQNAAKKGNVAFNMAKQVKINYQISLDYAKLCYCIDFTCEKALIKIIVKGDVGVLLENHQKAHFQSKDKEISTYVVMVDEKKLFGLRIKWEQRFHENDRVNCLVMADSQGRIIANSISIELKHLSLHHKVDTKLYDKSNKSVNALQITGEFKYFQVNLWLNAIFNDFGPSPENVQDMIETCYESLITKDKILVQYRDRQCQIYSESPTPLNIIKKAFIQKSKEKHLSLNYDVKTNIEGIRNLLKKMQPRIIQFEKNTNQFQLLPGLLELGNQSISSDLKDILNRSEEIKQKNSSNERQYQEIKNSIVDFFVNYKSLNNKAVAEHEKQEIKKQLKNFNSEKLLKLITG